MYYHLIEGLASPKMWYGLFVSRDQVLNGCKSIAFESQWCYVLYINWQSSHRLTFPIQLKSLVTPTCGLLCRPHGMIWCLHAISKWTTVSVGDKVVSNCQAKVFLSMSQVRQYQWAMGAEILFQPCISPEVQALWSRTGCVFWKTLFTVLLQRRPFNSFQESHYNLILNLQIYPNTITLTF